MNNSKNALYCHHCGEYFEDHGDGAEYCSDDCYEAHQEYHRAQAEDAQYERLAEAFRERRDEERKAA